MTGFDLPQNFTQNAESLLRKVRPHVIPSQIILPTDETVNIAPSTSRSMAQKTLREFSAPSASNVLVGPTITSEADNFEIRIGLITMVQVSPFCGKANEDANTHLQQFLELCSTFVIKGVTQGAIRLRQFPFSLLGKVKQWFYANRSTVNTWDNCTKAFLMIFFPLGKTNALHGKILSFQQHQMSQWPRLGKGFRSTS